MRPALRLACVQGSEEGTWERLGGALTANELEGVVERFLSWRPER
jgi:hypothetical protein